MSRKRSPLRLVARSARAAAGVSRAARARVGGVPPAGEIAVSYGLARVPREDEVAIGGIVKLQGLERRFPHSPRRFNILYLVSSRLPNTPVVLARAARAKGAAVVVNQNGVAYPAWHGEGWERTNEPMAALLEQASHVLYQSDFCRLTADRFLKVTPARWEILHNAVDATRFVPARPRPTRPLTLLLGGTQYARYRVEAALRTLALVRQDGLDARLIVAGSLRWPTDDTPRGDADRLARSLAIESCTTYTGPYTQADAPTLFHRADILLHTKYNDPCPTVVLEAMASGLPVAYSNSGGVPELVGDTAGVGVETEISWEHDIPPSPERLAQAVARIAGRLDAYGAAARRRAVERFDLQRWIARHEALFHELTAER